MKSRRRVPLKLALGLSVAVALDTLLQIIWKSAALTVPAEGLEWPPALAAVMHPLFIGVVVLMGLQFLNWIKVLDYADLSYAQPITSLSYVSVCVLSVLFLNETADTFQVLGIGFILLGVWCISRTDHATELMDGKKQ